MSDTPRTDANKLSIDDMERELAAVTAERDEAQKNYQFMVERAADKHLDGYRELAAKAAAAENERDELRAELERERARLVVCGAVARANTHEEAAKARDVDAAYRSETLSDVSIAVDEQMRLRAELADLRENWNALQKAIVGETGASAIREVDRMRAELGRAMRVVKAARGVAHDDNPHDASSMFALEEAVCEWEVGR